MAGVEGLLTGKYTALLSQANDCLTHFLRCFLALMFTMHCMFLMSLLL